MMGLGYSVLQDFQGFCLREGRFRVPGVRAVELRGLGFEIRGLGFRV